MTTVIKNGTIVTADLTYKADVLIDGGKIIEIGQNPSGDEQLDGDRRFFGLRRKRDAWLDLGIWQRGVVIGLNGLRRRQRAAKSSAR